MPEFSQNKPRARNLEESIAIPIGEGQQLHLRRIYSNPEGTPLFLLHGLGEDGEVFFSSEGHGIAHEMAYEGYDVYIGDLRGHGRSWPAISPGFKYDLHQAITADIPAFLEAIFQRKQMVTPVIMTHGMGAAMLTAFIARNPESLEYIKGIIHFGAYRQSAGGSSWKQFKLRWIWQRIAPLLVRLKGYVPGAFVRVFPGDEAAGFYIQALEWMQSERWVSCKDDFDYLKALQGMTLPPSLYLAEKKLSSPGDETDVRLFMRELGRHNGRLLVLGKKAGGWRNYGKGRLMLDGQAVEEGMPFISEWISSTGCTSG